MSAGFVNFFVPSGGGQWAGRSSGVLRGGVGGVPDRLRCERRGGMQISL
ncbi:MAG: hypothetical protein RRY35_04785 [Clostridiales bacterium]